MREPGALAAPRPRALPWPASRAHVAPRAVALRRGRTGRSRAGRLAILVAVLAVILVGLPGRSFEPGVVRAGAVCTGWTSETTPPPTIKVLRTRGPASGTVEVVPFHDYVTSATAAEWGSSSPPEALRAGAVAVKEYAWYFTMVWRGGTSGMSGSTGASSCYDVVDNTNDQIYSPETNSAAPSEAAAVDASWGMNVLKSGHLFPTHYRAGASVPCGANANGTNLYQVSAMNCAESGMPAAQILETYYGPGVVVAGGAATGAPGTASALDFSSQPGGGAAGTPFPVQPTVRIVDASGQTVTGAPGGTQAVTLALSSNQGGATLTCAGGPRRAATAGMASFTGCTVSATGTGYVIVASANGLVPATSTAFTITAAPPVLTLTAPPAATWGSAAPLTIRLEPPPGGAQVGGRPVHIQVSPDGAAWSGLADVTTDPLGAATFSYRPSSNRYVRAIFDGAPDLGAAASPTRRIVVRQLALLRPDNHGAVRSVPRGTKVTFTTLVRPVAATGMTTRVRYELYQRVGKAWVLRRTSTVAADAAGRTGFPVIFSAPGIWYVRSTALSTAANANSVWSPAQRYDVR